MDDYSRVETCRWSRLTLQMPYPVWLESEDAPWTCLRDRQVHPLEDDRVCRGCPRWEPRRIHLDDLPR
jgi:hypothetical protein